MHSSFILSTLLAGASLISAAALPSTALPRDLSQLTENDVIVYGNGRIEIRDKSEMADLAKRYASDKEMATRSLGPLPLEKKDASAEAHSKIEKRCSKETIYEMNPVQTFLGWDIAMSQVIHANGASASIAVSAGYTIANSVTTSVTVGVSIESFLTETLGISYQETWTSTYTSTINYGVPNGTYAAIVSNPFTTRNSGNVYIGCIGEPTESTYFQADSFSSKSYSGLDWVDGTISLCTGDSYPLKMCIGDGTL